MTQVQAEQTLDPTKQQFYHDLLKTMLLIRRFEERAGEAYALGQIGGFCHLYIGQEAVAVGSIAALRDDDYIVSSYRDHGHALAKGVSARSVMAELFGKATGCSGGKGGSMHLFDVEKRFMGGHGIVGGQIPLAAGIAFASRYRNEDNVTVGYFGDAAVNIGAFHETLNMAALWKLPAVFICENNRYGMGTAIERASSVLDIAKRGEAYNMHSETVDGMDVLAMHNVMTEAVARARKHGEPTLLDVRTYRYVGHSMSDPVHGVYRTEEEVKQKKEQDPIFGFAQRLEIDDLLTEDEMKAMDAEAKATVEDALSFAEESPDPEPEALYQDIYAD